MLKWRSILPIIACYGATTNIEHYYLGVSKKKGLKYIFGSGARGPIDTNITKAS